MFTKKQIEAKDGIEFLDYVRGALTAAQNAKSAFAPRWDVAQRMYRMEDGSAGTPLFEGVTVRPSALMTSRIDRIGKGVVQAVTAPTPWVSAIPEQPEQFKADELEEGLQSILEDMPFDQMLRTTTRLASLFGQAFAWVSLQEDGFDIQPISPRDFVMWPTWGATIDTADLVGHRYTVPEWRVKERQAAKEWRDFQPVQTHTEEQNRATDSTTAEGLNSVELWNLIVRVPVKDGKSTTYERYRIIYAPGTDSIVMVEPYIYSRPWYEKLTFCHEYGEFWTGDSPARRLEALQHAHSTLQALMECGTAATAMPPIIVSNGRLAEKYKSYPLGVILEAEGPFDAQVLPVAFNPGLLPQLLANIEAQADQLIGITQVGLGQELSSGTTATEAALLGESLRVAENDYTGYVAEFVEGVASLIHEMATLHAGTVKAAYRDKLQAGFFNALKIPVKWRVTGRNPEASPQAAMQKTLMLLDMARQPGSMLNLGKVERAAINTMRVQIDPEELFIDERQQAAELQQAPGMDGLAGMGMAPGAIPPGAGGMPQAGPGIDPGLAFPQ